MNQKNKRGTNRRETNASSLVASLTAGMSPQLAMVNHIDYKSISEDAQMRYGAFVYRFEAGSLPVKVVLHRLNATLTAIAGRQNKVDFFPKPEDGQLAVTPVYNAEALRKKMDMIVVPMVQLNQMPGNEIAHQFHYYAGYTFSGVRRFVKLSFDPRIIPVPKDLHDWRQELESIHRQYMKRQA
jgi:hypothetical protein